jgi:hypothetical protein
MNDPRLTPEELDLYVSFAYGGEGYRAGRKAQALTLGNLFRRKPARARDAAARPAPAAS